MVLVSEKGIPILQNGISTRSSEYVSFSKDPLSPSNSNIVQSLAVKLEMAGMILTLEGSSLVSIS
jgi:hypothetical protein